MRACRGHVLIRSCARQSGRDTGTWRENRQLEADFIGLKAVCETGLTVTFTHIFKARQRRGVEGTRGAHASL